MKLLSPLPVLTLCALALPAGDEIRFAPKEGLVVRRTFEATSDYSLEEADFTVDGESQLDEEPDLEVHAVERIVVVDELAEVGADRPLRLRRTFDELTNTTTFSSGEMDEEQVEKSDLEGETVVFTWSTEDEEYGVAADEDAEVGAELLEGLVEDMDFRRVLPDDEVEEGDSWDIDATVILTLMWPGGFVGFYDAEVGEIDEIQTEVNTKLVEALEGEARATYAGKREEDGVEVAVFQVSFDVTAETSLEVDVEEVEEELVEERSYGTRRQVEGEILWNLELGLLHSASLESDSMLSLGRSMTVEGPEGEVDLAERQVFRGTTNYRVKFEPEE